MTNKCKVKDTVFQKIKLILIVHYITYRGGKCSIPVERTIVYREACPRGTGMDFRRGLYTILFTINHLIKQATL
jgi:hypothetical protein